MKINVYKEANVSISVIEELGLKDTIKYICTKIRYNCSNIKWIIYNPSYPEKEGNIKYSTNSIQTIIMEATRQREEMLRKNGIISAFSKRRHEYGYCYIKRKEIYISERSVRLLTRSQLLYSALHKLFSPLNKTTIGIDRFYYKTKKNNKPDSLGEVILHELTHIITKKTDKGGFGAFLFDIKCFLGTVLSVAKSDGVVEGGTGEMKK